MMTFLGGWFHRASDYKLFVARFEPLRPTRYKEISEGFTADYATHMPDAAARDAVLRNIVKQSRAIPGGAAQATLADLKAFASRAEHLLPAEAGIQAAHDETLQSCAALGLKDQRAQAFFYLLRLILGPLPNQDPLQPWSHTGLAGNSDIFAENLFWVAIETEAVMQRAGMLASARVVGA